MGTTTSSLPWCRRPSPLTTPTRFCRQLSPLDTTHEFRHLQRVQGKPFPPPLLLRMPRQGWRIGGHPCVAFSFSLFRSGQFRCLARAIPLRGHTSHPMFPERPDFARDECYVNQWFIIEPRSV